MEITGKKRRKKKKSVKYYHPDLLKFTPRQLLYRKYRMQRMSIFAAALKAGYSKSYARSHAAQKVERVVKVSIIDELEMAGATNERQATELTRIAFEAMETEKCSVYRDNGEGDIVVDEARTERIDNHARLKGLDQIAKLKRQITSSSLLDSALNSDYTRVTFVLEKESNDRKNDSVDLEANSRVALANE